MNNYLRKKISMKVNQYLIGETISEELLSKLVNDYVGPGKYEIVWNFHESSPIGLKKLIDGCTVNYIGMQYMILHEGKYERALYPSQYIDINITDYRNEQIDKLLE